ncbi:MAG: hypothetical protein AABY83_01360 [Pseudomonadota bacterium]
MRKFKTSLMLILCFVMPMRGIAALSAFELPCPSPMASVVVDYAHHDSYPMDSCCHNDKSTKMASFCKAGQACPYGFQFSVPARLTHASVSNVVEPIPHVDALVLMLAPSGIWRPPVLL